MLIDVTWLTSFYPSKNVSFKDTIHISIKIPYVTPVCLDQYCATSLLKFQALCWLTKLGVPFGKCQRGEFVYLLWNVSIQIFAVCCIILEVYNGFSNRKGWHLTLEKKLGYILGFHFY